MPGERRPRKCTVCGKPLSQYNPNRYCFCHALKMAEKKSRDSERIKARNEAEYQKAKKEEKCLSSEQ